MNELFDMSQEKKDWEKEWVNMPEFDQKKVDGEYAKITVRFRNQEDLQEFSELVKQKLTKKTKAIYYPAIERGLDANKIYVYDAEVSDIHSK